MKLPVYLDYNATTPCDPKVVEAMLPYFTEKFGNADSNSHALGWIAAEGVDHARDQVAGLINADVTEITFTSGATEAINLAIKGVFETYSNKGNHIITCATEHKAVLDICKHLEQLGAMVTYVSVDENGLIDLEGLEAAITDKTILISVMYANNETGVIQPIKEISKIARSRNVLFFCDATQAVGKIPVDVQRDGIDLMAFSSHKMYGPKGVGALYARRRNPRVKLAAQIHGGGHERGIRSGTLNVPGIVGFGKACGIIMHTQPMEAERVSNMRTILEQQLTALDGVQINGKGVERLPHVTNLYFDNCDGLINAVGKYIAVSNGSACTSAVMQPSHVLKAMGLSDAVGYNSVRFSLGRFTTAEEVDYAIDKIERLVFEMRALNCSISNAN